MNKAAAVLTGDASLTEIGQEQGWPVQVTQPFTRLQFVPGLGRDTEAVGEAFGLPVGEIGGPVDAGETVVLLEVLEKSELSADEFVAAAGAIMAQLTIQQQQQQLNQWLAGVREQAVVEDLRDRLVQQQDNSPFGTS